MGILCGVDIIEVDRIKRAVEREGRAFTERVFTLNEIAYCEERNAVKYKSYAARFAAKEAVSKAFGTGISDALGWKDIEVLNDPSGKPYISFSDKSRKLYESLGAVDISISLSHCGEYAVAYAVIMTRGRE